MRTGICENCKEEKKVILHHISYENEVIVPLCKSCHKKIHYDRESEFYPIDKSKHTTIRLEKYVVRKLKILSLQKETTMNDLINQLVNKENAMQSTN